MSSNLQFRFGWETNQSSDLVIDKREVQKRESIVYCSWRRNSRARENMEEDKWKGSFSIGSVMLCFYICRIKSMQMTTWEKKRSIQMIGVHNEAMAVSVIPNEIIQEECVWKDSNDFISDTRIKMTTSQNKSSQIACVHKKAVAVTAYMDLLPKEMIEDEFLFRLPVKTLMRLKCVSKAWNDLVSDDIFRRRYQSRQQANGKAPTGFICGTIRTEHAAVHGLCFPCCFLYKSENYVKKKQLERFKYLIQAGPYVIAASKGLVLFGTNLNLMSVCDLVSKKHVDLPPKQFRTMGRVCVGFKCEENHNLGSPFYKVVCVDILQEESRSIYYVEIYSSKTGYWVQSVLKSTEPFLMGCYQIAKVIRGVFHWFVESSNCFIAYNDSDAEEGRVVFIELPKIDSNIIYRRKLRQLEGTKDGSLQFVSLDEEESLINIWIMNKKSKSSSSSYMDEEDRIDANRWSLSCSVSLWNMGIGFDTIHKWQAVPCLIGPDPIDPHIIYLHIGQHIYAYHHHQGKVVFKFSKQVDEDTDVFVHIEWRTWPCITGQLPHDTLSLVE